MEEQDSVFKVPAELLIKILSKVDGRDLEAASKVNQQWQNAVEVLVTCYNFWYTKCMEAMGVETIVQMTGLTQLLTVQGRREARQRKDRWTFWKELYDIHHQTKILDHLLEAESPIFSQITVGNRRNNMKAIKMGGCQGFEDEGAMAKTYFLVRPGLRGQPGAIKISREDRDRAPIPNKLIRQMNSAECYHSSVLGPYVLGHHRFDRQSLTIYKMMFARDCHRQHIRPMAVPIIELRSSLHPYDAFDTITLSYDRVVAGTRYGSLFEWPIPLLDFDDDQDCCCGDPDYLQDRIKVISKPTDHGHMGQFCCTVLQMAIHRGTIFVIYSEEVFERVGYLAIFELDGLAEVDTMAVSERTIRRAFKHTLARKGRFSICSMVVFGNTLALMSATGACVLINIEATNWFDDVVGNCICLLNLRAEDPVPEKPLRFRFQRRRHDGDLVIVRCAQNIVGVLAWKRLKDIFKVYRARGDDVAVLYHRLRRLCLSIRERQRHRPQEYRSLHYRYMEVPCGY